MGAVAKVACERGIMAKTLDDILETKAEPWSPMALPNSRSETHRKPEMKRRMMAINRASEYP